MTEVLCHIDSYLREFDATVVGSTPNGVVLDRTAFYPGGGGQPAEAGASRPRRGPAGRHGGHSRRKQGLQSEQRLQIGRPDRPRVGR